jgi:hypothetical protein
MKKMLSIIILLVLPSVSFNAFSQNDKVLICHKGKEISVAAAGVSAHINQHGDTRGECPEVDPEPESEPEFRATVVMMRCEGVADNSVLIVSASSSQGLGVVAGLDCAVTLSRLLNTGHGIRSITSGSAEEGDGMLHFYTDYLLLGKEPVSE